MGFSPLSNRKKLRRQQGFIQKQPESSSQVSKLINMFEVKQESPAAIGVTPVQSWRSWMVQGDSANYSSNYLGSLSKPPGKTEVLKETPNIQNGVDNLCRNDQSESISTLQSNSQSDLKINTNRTNSNVGGRIKRRYRSGSFRECTVNDSVKKVKLETESDSLRPENVVDTGNDFDSCSKYHDESDSVVSFGKSGNVEQGKSGMETPASQTFVRKSSVRKSLRDNFFLLNDSKESLMGTVLPRTTSASGLPPKPLPGIKSIKSDSTVGTKTINTVPNKQSGSSAIKVELSPPRTVVGNGFSSPLPDLDTMFEATKRPAHRGIPGTPSIQPLQELANSPNLVSQFKVLSLNAMKDSPQKAYKDSPKLEKKRSRTGLLWRKKNSSSTSRFRGTPIKTKLTPLIPKEIKSCSALGEQEFSSPIGGNIRIRTPYKVHSTPVTSAQQAFELDTSLSKEFNKFKLTPMKSSFPSMGTPVKSIGKLMSKLKTPKRNPKVEPLEDLKF